MYGNCISSKKGLVRSPIRGYLKEGYFKMVAKKIIIILSYFISLQIIWQFDFRKAFDKSKENSAGTLIITKSPSSFFLKHTYKIRKRINQSDMFQVAKLSMGKQKFLFTINKKKICTNYTLD